MSSIQSSNLEQCVLAAILQLEWQGKTEELDQVFHNLRPSDFALLEHREIFESARRIRRNGGPIGIQTVFDECKGDQLVSLSYIAGLDIAVQDSDIFDLPDWQARLIDYSSRRRLRDVFKTQSLSTQRCSTKALIKHFFGALSDEVLAMATRLQVEDVNAGEVMLRALEAIQDQSPDDRTTTGFNYLDRYVTGGFSGEDSVVLAGQTGKGKTAMAHSIMLALLGAGRRVSYFSAEFSLKRSTPRLLAMMTGIDNRKIANKMCTSSELARLVVAAKQVGSWPIKWHTESDLDSIVRKGLADKVKHGTEFIFIDHLHRTRHKNKMPGDIETITRATACFKDLFNLKHKVCTIALSQLNRDVMKEGQDREPTLRDIRQAASIEQDSDEVIFPYFDKNTLDANFNAPASLILAKNRWGPTGKIPARWHGKITSYRELSN